MIHSFKLFSTIHNYHKWHKRRQLTWCIWTISWHHTNQDSQHFLLWVQNRRVSEKPNMERPKCKPWINLNDVNIHYLSLSFWIWMKKPILDWLEPLSRIELVTAHSFILTYLSSKVAVIRFEMFRLKNNIKKMTGYEFMVWSLLNSLFILEEFLSKQ